MSYAKTLPPVLPSLFARTRLYDLLDQYRDRSALWLQGQAGAGKTTLVAGYIKRCDVPSLWYRMDAGDDDPATFFHYFSLAGEALLSAEQQLPRLTTESLSNLSQFSRLYFRELFAALPKPFLLVFDNFHAIAPDSPLNEIIAVALSEIPRTLTAILISRNLPPASLSRMQVNRKLVLVEQSRLRLTDEEACGLARLWLSGEIQAQTIQRLNSFVDGWVAGLVLLLERGGHDQLATGLGKEFFFSYFASEIFDTLPIEKQRFLLQTACLNGMTSDVARELTGVSEAQGILEDLCARHYFTSRSEQAEPVYQYHPLFRDFLLSRAIKDLGAQDHHQILVRAANILARVGQIEEAMVLAQAAADWSLLGKLILQQAPLLFTQQRLQLLEQWLKQLPQDQLSSFPWLHYWFGCCRRPFDQRESVRHFALAYAGFRERQAQDGLLLSASGAILAIMTEWDDFRPLDPWIAALDDLVAHTPVYPSADAEGMVVLAMLGALFFRRPQHSAMARWEAHADRLIRKNEIDISLRMDIGNVLVHWQYWKGDLATAEHTSDILTQMVAAGRSAALPRLLSVMNHAIHDWHTADFDRCLGRIEDGLALAEETGIHILDDRLLAQSVYASLSRDDLPTARRYLDRMKPILGHGRRLALSQYHYISSNYHLIAGDLELARHHGQLAVTINREVGVPFPEGLAAITLAQIHFELGELESAKHLLARGRTLAEDIQSRTLELLYQLTAAWFKLQQGQDEAALPHLRRALRLQRRMGFLNFPGWRSSQMKPLLLRALENDIEPAFAQQLIQKHGLRTEAPPQASERWPWPVKIYALGRFSLLLDGQPLQFSGRAQEKPLELLKVMLALGGREIGKERLIDILWPETDGDKAHRTLDTTLHRVRKLLGYEQVILVQDRKLSLNAQLCWVDVWALERLLGQTEALLGRGSEDAEQAVQLQQQLVSLYKSGFLGEEEGPDCISDYRARLHHRYRSRLSQLGSYWEQQTDWNRALSLYRQMLEMDDRPEPIHQRLMACYRNLGRIAEAVAAYERCRQALFNHFGTSPSAETEALYQSLDPGC